MITRTVAVALLGAATLTAQVRLDTSRMRNDLFAGLAGDREALTRVLDASEKTIGDDPNHAQALAWHGAATVTLSSRLQSENQQVAIATFQKGIADMDRAVELAPGDLEVRALRGVLLAPLSRQMPLPFSERMLEKARSDYQRMFDVQRDVLGQLVTHPLGELLQGLGDIYSRQGKPDEAATYYGLILKMLKDTEYARRAAVWMQTKQPLPADQTACVGCHTGK